MHCIRHFSSFANVLGGVFLRSAGRNVPSASHRAVKSGDRGGQVTDHATVPHRHVGFIFFISQSLGFLSLPQMSNVTSLLAASDLISKELYISFVQADKIQLNERYIEMCNCIDE